MQCTQNNESTHSEMDPVRQNLIQKFTRQNTTVARVFGKID